MINRVQAFNNKNNYNQNFGMAVGYADEATRATMRSIGKQWGERGKKIVQSAIKELQANREADECVDVIFYNSAIRANQVNVDIFDKAGDNIARGIDIFVEMTPEAVRAELSRLNKIASEHESAILDKDVLVGIPRIQCAQSRK